MARDGYLAAAESREKRIKQPLLTGDINAQV